MQHLFLLFALSIASTLAVSVHFAAAATPANLETDAGVSTFIAGSDFSGDIDGTGSAARFNGISDLVVLPSGVIVVSDQHKLRQVTQAGAVSTFAGSATSGFVDGSSSAARFNRVSELEMAANGEYFLAVDQSSKQIRNVSASTGAVSTVGNFSTGGLHWTFVAISGFALLSNSAGEQDGDMIVTDQRNRTVFKVTRDGYAQYIAGSLEGNQDGIGGAALFQLPNFVVAVPSRGGGATTAVLVLDYGRLRKVDLATAAVTTLTLTVSEPTYQTGQLIALCFPDPSRPDQLVVYRHAYVLYLVNFTTMRQERLLSYVGPSSGSNSGMGETKPVGVLPDRSGFVSMPLSGKLYMVSFFPAPAMPNSIPENSPEGTTVGTFSQPSGKNITQYTVFNGTNRFTVSSSGVLKIGSEPPNYEVEPQIFITFKAYYTDSFIKESSQFQFTAAIQITDVVEPFNMTLSATSIDENLPVGTEIGTVQCYEKEAASYTLSIIAGGAEFNLSSTTSSPSSLLSRKAFDYETTSSYSVTIRCQSNRGNRIDKTFTIAINDVLIAMGLVGSTSIAENTAAGTNLGRLTCAGDGVTSAAYSLSAVNPTTSVFQVSASTGQLTNKVPLNYEERSSYKVQVRCVANNDNSLFVEKNYTLTVVNQEEAPVITATGVTSFKIGVGESFFSTVPVIDEDAGDTFSCSTPSYPSWLTFSSHSSNFKIYGTPTKEETGSSFMTVTCTDSKSRSASVSFYFTVQSSLRIAYPSTTSPSGSGAWNVSTPANTLTVVATLLNPSAGRLSLGLENFALASYDATLGELTVFGISGSVNKELNDVRYVPAVVPSRQQQQGQSLSVKIKDGVNFDSTFSTTTNVFKANRAPQFRPGTSALPSFSVRTSQQLSIHLLSYFVDQDGDTITLSAKDAGKPSLSSWAVLESTQLALYPDKSHEGQHTFDITAQDPFEGKLTTQITVKVELSGFDQMVSALELILQVGAPAISVLVFLIGLFRSRSALYNHVSFRRYHWLGRFPRDLFEGKPFHPQKPPPNAPLRRNSASNQMPPPSPIVATGKNGGEATAVPVDVVEEIIDRNNGMTAMVLTDTTDDMRSIAADPQNVCRVVVLVDKKLSGWCCWNFHGSCCGANCCMCLSKRTQMLGYRLESPLEDLPDWLHFDAASNALIFYRELVPTDQQDTFLIQILDKDGFMLFETCLPTAALERHENKIEDQNGDEVEPHQLRHPHHLQHPLHQPQRRYRNKEGGGEGRKGGRAEEVESEEGSHHSPFGPKDDMAHWAEKVSLLEHEVKQNEREMTEKHASLEHEMTEKHASLERKNAALEREMEELRRTVK